MSLNLPQSNLGSGPEEPGSRRGYDSVPTQSPGGPDEVARLQDLLSQALRREAEAHKKMKHLYEQLQSALHVPRTISVSDTSQVAGSDIMSWCSELSQTSPDLSPSTPPPVVVVQASPHTPRKYNFTSKVHPESPHSLVLDAVPVNGKLDLGCHHNQLDTRLPRHDSLDKTEGHLAPSGSDYRGVRQEMEKPPTPTIIPPVLSTTDTDGSTHQTNSAYQGNSSQPAADSSPSSSKKRSVVLDLSPSSVSDDFSHLRGSSSANKTLPSRLNRSISINDKHKIRDGHRARSNSNFLPGWMRKKRSGPGKSNSTSSVPSSVHIPHEDSMEEMFHQVTVNLQQDVLAKYIDRHWSEVCKDRECSREVQQYRDAVWDLFQTEAKFLVHFLQPLEQVYKGYLEELHFHAILMIADVDKIFANLSELCELSSGVATDLFKLFDGRSGDRIARNKELIWAFSMFGHKFNPVYQRFCVNFEKQRGFLCVLEQLPDFKDYLKLCRSHESVRKNDLKSLLISPLQHQCRYQLLLEKVLKYTPNQSEKELLSSAIKAFVVSLKELETNIAENKRSEELLTLQETLCWPTLSQLDPAAYIPETLMSKLSCQPCSDVLAHKDRQLVYHGQLKLLESKSRPARDLDVFLFTDLLLLTQQNLSPPDKRTSKKESRNQLTKYYMCGHPILLTQLDIHDVPYHQLHGHLLTLVERNSFQQQVAVYSLQAISKDDKAKWCTQLIQTKRRNTHGFLESDV